jgi:hypothetical protein
MLVREGETTHPCLERGNGLPIFERATFELLADRAVRSWQGSQTTHGESSRGSRLTEGKLG